MDAISLLRFSAVMPSSFMTVSPGAEKPKRSTPTTLLAYLYQRPVTPASMAIRFVQDEGSTLSLYSDDWRSNNSMQGMDTTRAPGRLSAALRAWGTSDPVAMMIRS